MNSVLKMTDTEYDWIGTIPSHWTLKKIKFVFWDRKENNNPIKSENLISLTIEKGVIPHSEKTGGGNKPKEDLTKYKLVYPGDIVLNSMNVIAGAVGISKYFGVVSPVYYMLIPRELDHSNEYFHHLFRTETFQKSLYGLGNGILIKENEETGKLNTIRMRIPMDKLGDQFIPVPPAEEQKLIARYLNKKTEQIDLFVGKIQKKIKLLKEQRTALINHCVTKGLNPNVEMKDSGIEWIGEIPKHWDVKKLKNIVNERGLIRGPFGGSLKVDTFVPKGYKVYEQKNAIYNNFSLGTAYINDKKYDELKRFSIQKNDILMSCSGTIGKTSLVKGEFEKGIINQALLIIRLEVPENTLPKYIQTVFSSSFFQEQVIDNSHGGAMKNLVGIDVFKNVKVPIPAPSEQLETLKYIDKKYLILEELLIREKLRVERLKEYRQSLISSVVTGKVRITEDMI